MKLEKIKDVNPRKEESKNDFISRFMSETKEEYPNVKQRLAVAYSTWRNKMNDSIKDSEKLFFRAAITNLGKYNEGELIFKWVDFPIDEESFNKVLDEIGINEEYEEWFVTDYDTNIPGYDWQDLGEYPSYDTLNSFAEKFENAEDSIALANVFEVTGDIDEALEGLENGTYYFYEGIDNDSELGEYVINNFYGGEISKELFERYFDYESLGRDLSFDNYDNPDYDEEDPGSEEYINAGEFWCGDEDASDYEIGEAYVDEVGIDGVVNKDYYFDYGAFGRDLSFENFTFTTDGVVEEAW